MKEIIEWEKITENSVGASKGLYRSNPLMFVLKRLNF